MNRPRESLLTLFDPLFSGDPATPPPCRDVPSPDLGSDKENAAPSASGASDNSITLTKFFNRIYTRPKAQLPRSLPKGQLIDVGDANVSDDDDMTLTRILTIGEENNMRLLLITTSLSLLLAEKKRRETRPHDVLSQTSR
jgi:hypothetical protein